MAGNATIAGKLNKTVSISMQRSLVTNLCDPRVTSDPCDKMETKLNLRNANARLRLANLMILVRAWILFNKRNNSMRRRFFVLCIAYLYLIQLTLTGIDRIKGLHGPSLITRPNRPLNYSKKEPGSSVTFIHFYT